MRTIELAPPFDLARTAAPAWWARGRWPNVDWQEGAFTWVGWEQDRVVWRSVRQIDELTLSFSGTGLPERDRHWASRVLGIDTKMPAFDDPIVASLAIAHRGMKPWAAGSLYEGVVSSIVGQSISVLAAATTEQRLYSSFNGAIEIGGRNFWPPPLPEQLATADTAFVRASGVTTKRAQALVEVGAHAAAGLIRTREQTNLDVADERQSLLAISGIGPWTVRSAGLWGIGEADAHPTGDVALLRAIRKHYPETITLKDVDSLAERWKPFRGWAARLFWLDLLGFDDDSASSPIDLIDL